MGTHLQDYERDGAPSTETPRPESACANPTAAVIDKRAPETELANMGMRILAGLGMVGMLMLPAHSVTA